VSEAITGVRAKLARSLEHLVELDEAVGRYLDTKPIDVRRNTHESIPRNVLVFELVLRESPPLDLSVRAGDVIHQMRSALDHIACELVRASGATPSRGTSFPVCVEPPSELKIRPSVASSALRVVETLQPYRRGPKAREHPLAILNELWNVDKHRNLHLTTTSVKDAQTYLVATDGGAMVGGQLKPVAAAGQVLAIFPFQDEPDPSDWELATGGGSFVAFADEGPWGSELPMTVILEELHRYVSESVLDALMPHLR
jgi:hypothetical protein